MFVSALLSTIISSFKVLFFFTGRQGEVTEERGCKCLNAAEYDN